MRQVWLGLLTGTALVAAAQAALADGAALGTWIMANGKVTVQVAACGQGLCGTVVGLKKPLDGQGNPKLDKLNPDPAKRQRPVIGLTVLDNMMPASDGSWHGTIYNADDGRTYTSSMRLDGDSMKVKGCVVVFCRKLLFKRLP